MSSRYIERVILGEDRGAASWLIRCALWPLSLIYRAGLAVYLGLYSVGLKQRYKLSVPIISVGNLTFGGTGKTPAVQTICRLLVQSGKKVVVLSRGHGGSAEDAVAVSDGEQVLIDSAEAGDEPVLLAQSLPGVPVVVGKDRRLSGNLACEKFKPDIIVLDDGLQYWQLYRDLDIVVMSAARPFGSGFVMPMGDLREPANGLRRAGIVLLNTDGKAEIESVEKRIKRVAPRVEIYRCERKPERFIRVSDGQPLDLDWIKDRRVLAFCGIGKPQSFMDMLVSLGAVVARQMVFSDHHEYLQEDISLIESEKLSSGAEVVVTTQKDIARLGNHFSIEHTYTLVIRLEVEDKSSFAQRINNKNTQSPT
ncbi:MAG: tetraacyldisaccharide 4'-kinase [Armatimonadota bacterium]